MSASMDNGGSAGAEQTWPLATAAAATAVPLPAEAKAPPHPSPLPQAGEGAVSPPVPLAGEGIVSPPAPQARESVALPPLPLAGEGWGEGKPAAGDTQTTIAATPTPTPTAQTAQPASFNPPATTSGAVGGTVLALLLVVGVILALAWLAKRMPGIGTGGGNPALKIVGSLALGPRERVIVVAVGNTQLLLSTGPHGTRALHTLSEPLPVAAAIQAPHFARLLAKHLGRKP